MEMPLDTGRLAALVAVARERGFSRAARALGRTQPAVSNAISHLERELGQPLFVRQRHGVVPTEAGRTLLEHAERALGELAQARARLSSLAALREGRLVIGASDT